ncbi:hypothetical protein, partial [Candidatus Symbiothrix dinenymphae]|uniref:hypothetical protein n=1 Tax=Candidatus Symbiothrix dinenymphae TaxID=467085 RepID=UPI0013155915
MALLLYISAETGLLDNAFESFGESFGESVDTAPADIKNLTLASGKCYRWAPADFDVCDTEIETDCGIGSIYLDKNGVVILSEDCLDNPTTYFIGTYSAKNEEYHFKFTQYCNSHRKEITPLDEDLFLVLEPLNCLDWAYQW